MPNSSDIDKVLARAVELHQQEVEALSRQIAEQSIDDEMPQLLLAAQEMRHQQAQRSHRQRTLAAAVVCGTAILVSIIAYSASLAAAGVERARQLANSMVPITLPPAGDYHLSGIALPKHTRLDLTAGDYGVNATVTFNNRTAQVVTLIGMYMQESNGLITPWKATIPTSQSRTLTVPFTSIIVASDQSHGPFAVYVPPAMPTVADISPPDLGLVNNGYVQPVNSSQSYADVNPPAGQYARNTFFEILNLSPKRLELSSTSIGQASWHDTLEPGSSLAGRAKAGDILTVTDSRGALIAEYITPEIPHAVVIVPQMVR